MSGIILILHSGLRRITETEVYPYLEPQHKNIPTKVVEIMADLPLEGAEHIHWRSYAAQQEEVFNRNLKPLMDQYPDYALVYFGLTHIPLTLHLGYLIGGARNVQVYQQNYRDQTWRWQQPDALLEPPQLQGLPTDRIGGDTEAVVRFGSYVRIDPEDTRAVVPNAQKEVDFHLQSTQWDSIVSRQQVEEIAGQFAEITRTLGEKMPGLRAIHLMAAIPCGLGILMGQKVRATMDPPIHVYHFRRANIEDGEPKYRFALVLQDKSAAETPVTPEERETLANLRQTLKAYYAQTLLPYVRTQLVHTGWVPRILPLEACKCFQASQWATLAPLSETNLDMTEIALDTLPGEEDRFFRHPKWYLSDGLLHALHHRLAAEDQVKMALRLFIFHEAIHFKSHRMRPEQAREMGRYPKTLEALDYQADVYALIQEYAMQTGYLRSSQRPQLIFAETIETMIETMWAFDANARGDEMQVRRMNRYLIWYLQRERILDPETNSLERILEILHIKPEIELRGLWIKTDHEGRVMAELTGFQTENLGLAAVVNNELHRHGHESGAMNLRDLVEGFRTRNGQLIQDTLAALVAQMQ